MATLYVRNFPDELYHSVQSLAKTKNMSISTEIISVMEEVIEKQQRKDRQLATLARVAEHDQFFKPSIDGKDTTDLLREDRDR